MIHPNDRVENEVIQRDFAVISVHEDHLQCVAVADTSIRMNPQIDTGTLTFPKGAGWRVVQCPHVDFAPPKHYTTTDHAAFYARLIGVMEYRLVSTYTTILRAIEMNDGDHVASVQWNLAWAKERIEASADHMATMEHPNTAITGEWLRDEIYSLRK